MKTVTNGQTKQSGRLLVFSDPILVTERFIVTNESGCQRQRKDGSWGTARPLGYRTWKTRFRLAWRVFTGKYDAFEWSE